MKHAKINLPAIVMMLASGLWLTSATPLRAQMAGGAGMAGSPQGQMGGQPQPGMNNPRLGNGANAMGQQNNPQAVAERNFLGTMRRNNKVETELSKLALKKSTNDNVKKFAQQVITENHRTGNSLSGAASSANIMTPDEVPSETKKIMKQMKGQTGTQFDASYISQMDGYVKSDQKATTENSGSTMPADMQAMSMQLRRTADNRAQQLSQIAQSENFKLQ